MCSLDGTYLTADWLELPTILPVASANDSVSLVAIMYMFLPNKMIRMADTVSIITILETMKRTLVSSATDEMGSSMTDDKNTR